MMTNTNAAAETRMIADVQIFTLNAAGNKILKSRRGARVFAIGVLLSDGSALVSKTHRSGSEWALLPSLAKLKRNVDAGFVREEIRGWDSHERSFYAEFSPAAVGAI